MKTVVRCAAFEASHAFYAGVLGLHPVEQWTEPQGRGCVFALETHGSGTIEIYEMSPTDERFDESFRRPFGNDKVDLQFRVESVDAWAERVRGLWKFAGPETLSWGQRWIKLRDPDGLLIAIYENR